MASDTVGSVVQEQAPLSIPASEPGAWATAMSNLGIVPMINGGPLGTEPLCLPRFDPGLGLLAPLNPLLGLGLVHSPGSGPGPEVPVVKEIIHCNSCTLFPQNPNLPPPSTRERPPGCRTVFVGGLPENATEEIIRDVFDQCGEITAIRKSKKNFCHIRFSEEFMVDKAMYLSGYRMRLGSSTDKKDSGKIHVDFAQARDDLYEWECKQRLWAREERHRVRVQEELLHPPSPPPIMHYSDHEAALLAERLKEDHKFSDATAVLFSWIDRGEVNRRNANHFYSMIQSTNGHVRQLMMDKAQHEEELERAKESFKNALLTILSQFEQINGVFAAASKQKAWDHFTKAQRKNIDIWRKQCEELRNAHSEEIMGIRREEEMEMSDEEEELPCKRIRIEQNGVQSQASLCEENDSLRWQLDAYRNEVDLLRRESRPRGPEEEHGLNQGLNNGLNHGLNSNHNLNSNQGLTQAEAQIQQLQQSMHHLQQQLLGLQDQLRSREDELEQAREEQRNLEGELHSLTDKLLNNNTEAAETNTELQEKVVNGCVSLCPSRERRADGFKRGGIGSEREALLLGVMCTFLHVHPFGANLEYLWSYMQRLDSKVTAAELERLMLRLPSMFRQELSGVGANLEKRWKFCGFNTLGTQ